MKIVELCDRAARLEVLEGALVERTVLEVVSDLALTGIGEADGHIPSRAWETVRPLVAGMDPRDFQLIRNGLRGKVDPRVVAGLEAACLDLVGKAAGQPVCRLLGGKLRPAVHLIPVLSTGCPEAMAEEARSLIGCHGFRAVTVRVGGMEVEEAVHAVATLRERLGSETSLRLDAGGIWPGKAAGDFLSTLEGHGIEMVIDPSEGRIRGESSIPVVARLGERGWQGIFEGAGEVDGMLVDPWSAGGFSTCLAMAGALQDRGIRLGLQGGQETGLGLAARLHLAGALPVLEMGMESMYHEVKTDVLRYSLLEHRNGEMLIPPGPGFGVTLDPDRLG